MHPMRHLPGIIRRPGAEWDAIARDDATPRALLGTVLMLCVIPALSTLIGMTVFDARWSPLHGYRVAPDRVLAVALGNFTFAIAMILMLALVFHWLAVPTGKQRASIVASLKVAIFGSIPMLLAAGFLVLPVMVVLLLVAGIHCLYLYNLGLQKVLGVRAEDTAILLAVCVVLASVAAGVLGSIASAVGLF